MCITIYNNPHALDQQLTRILDNPQKGSDVSWDVAANPEGSCKLAEKIVLGVKTPKRLQAENDFGSLCVALDAHVTTAKRLHKDFTREQARQQAHERGESTQRRHHHTREERQHSPEREVQQRKEEGKKMAFAL